MGVYEQSKDWIGDEATMVGPYSDPKGFSEMLDRIVEWKCSLYGGFAAAGTDIVWIGDDLGTQRSLVMSPAQYREWYRPRHQRIVDHLRSIKSDVKIAFHCCGHVTPLIRDLIEVGIDILEAVQPECMDLSSSETRIRQRHHLLGRRRRGKRAEPIHARTGNRGRAQHLAHHGSRRRLHRRTMSHLDRGSRLGKHPSLPPSHEDLRHLSASRRITSSMCSLRSLRLLIGDFTVHFIPKRLAGHFVAGPHANVHQQPNGHRMGEKVRAAVTN